MSIKKNWIARTNIHTSIYLYIDPSICLSVYPPTYLSIYLCINLPIFVSINVLLKICIYTHISIPAHTYIYPPIELKQEHSCNKNIIKQCATYDHRSLFAWTGKKESALLSFPSRLQLSFLLFTWKQPCRSKCKVKKKEIYKSLYHILLITHDYILCLHIWYSYEYNAMLILKVMIQQLRCY